MRVLLFEDAWTDRLAPITHSRPPFLISCGSYRLLDLVRELGLPLGWVVRPHLRPALALELTPRSAGAANGSAAHGPAEEETSAADAGPTLLVNGSIVPRAEVRELLRGLVSEGSACQARIGGRLAAAFVPAGQSAPRHDADLADLDVYVDRLGLPERSLDVRLWEWPHDVIREHLLACSGNLEDRLRRGEYRQVQDGVFLAPGAKLGPYVVTDSSRGPIVLESDASIGPYCFLAGPVHVGPRARVIEHAALKDCVAIGPTTKIGGEVEASTIEAFTNKQHHGFLGHSYLGSWINLGAGTCNSDLKNTYGPVNMKYGQQKVSSRMQFLGCIMGDYSKTAINTSIFTGKTIGVCSMLYGFVTTNVPSFVNYARSFGQVTESPVEVMIAMQGRMFARRNVAQHPADVLLLREMYELTRHERQMAGGPLTL